MVTVAICTHNRAKFLDDCLRGLAASNRKQSFPVLVVDNASADDTSAVVARHGVSYVKEDRIGLSNARNTALSNCKTEYLVFLDDDGIPDEGWCDSIAAGIEQWIPDVFGGPFGPYYLTEKPPWFLDEYGSAHMELEEGLCEISTCFSGGNMGWRTSLLNELGGFSPHLGMIGGKLGLGEETALQVSMRSRPELRRVFLASMMMHHYVPPFKMQLGYIARRSFQYGYQLFDIDPHDRITAGTSIIGLGIRSRAGFPMVARLLFRDRVRYPHWATFASKYLSLHMIEAGALWRKLSSRLGAGSHPDRDNISSPS